MTKRLTGFTVLAVTMLVLASFPLFNHPSAVAQSEGGGFGACVDGFTISCLETDAETCTMSISALWYGEGTFCHPDFNIVCSPLSNCPPISSACCLGDGTCVVLIPELCLESNGTPSPMGTACSGIFEVTCPQPCDADTDGDGTVGILDFLDVLAAWGPCP